MKGIILKKILIISCMVFATCAAAIWYKGGIEKEDISDPSALWAYLCEDKLERMGRKIAEGGFAIKTWELIMAYNNIITDKKKETLAELERAKAAWVTLVLDQIKSAWRNDKSMQTHAARIINRIKKDVRKGIPEEDLDKIYRLYLPLITEVLIKASDGAKEITSFDPNDPADILEAKVSLGIKIYQGSQETGKTTTEFIEETNQELRAWAETALDLALKKWILEAKLSK